MNRHLLMILGVLSVMICADASVGMAQEVRVFQQKPFLRRERVEIAPVVGLTTNDSMIEHYSLGGTINYHISETMAAGLSYWRMFGAETSLYDKMTNDYNLLPSIIKTEALMSAQFSYAIMYGKFALFNTWSIHYDTTLQAGLGAAQTSLGNLNFAFDYGMGQRYFLTDWLSFNWELRHYMYSEESLVHNILLVAGVGVFIPFDFDYRTLK